MNNNSYNNSSENKSPLGNIKVNSAYFRKEQYQNKSANDSQTQPPTMPVNNAVNPVQAPTMPVNRAVNYAQPQTASSAQNNQTFGNSNNNSNNTSNYYSSPQQGNSSESDIPVKAPDLKNHVFYNESALTPPDKKSNAVIVVIFIFLIALLLFGLIGFALTVEEDINKSPYSSYLNKNHFDNVFVTSSSLENYAKNKTSSSNSVNDTGIEKYSIPISENKELVFSIPIRYSASESGATDIELKNYSGDVINLSILLDDSGSANEEYNYYRSYSKYWEEPDYTTIEGKAKLICVSEPDGAYQKAAALIDSRYGLISVTLTTENTEDYMTNDLFILLRNITGSFEERSI